MNNVESPIAIEVAGVGRAYGRTPALDGVDLTVPTGSVYGLLGPNGAGKTTLIRILATLLRPDRGRARVFGHDVVSEARAVRSRISLTGQFSSVDDDLTGWENLVLLGRLLGHSHAAAKQRAVELLEAFELAEARRRQVRTYSGGMRRRLDIAASIVVMPDLIFLDEPTTGLDPQSRNSVWQIIRALVTRGCTVLLTTQYLDEADQLADRIGVINEGRMVAEGTSAELKRSVGTGSLRLRLVDAREASLAAQVLAASHGETGPTGSDSSTISARVAGAEDAFRALVALSDAGITPADFALTRPSLDEVFLALTGSPAASSATTQEQAQTERAMP